MYTGLPDLNSLLLYVLLSFAYALLLYFGITAEQGIVISTPEYKGKKLDISRKMLYYGAFVLLFTFFAVFRKIDYNLGGADGTNYANFFFFSNFDISPYSHLISEPIFVYVNKLLRVFTTEYRVFFAIAYSFLAVSYCKFANKYFPKNASCIPLVLVGFLFCKSLCTLRTSLSVAFILIGLCHIEGNRKKSFIWIALSVLVHRASIFFVLVWFFYVFCKKYVLRLKGKNYAIAVTVINLALILVGRIGQNIIVLTKGFGLLSSTDIWYFGNTRTTPLIARFPMYMAQTLLFVAIVLLEKRIQTGKEFKILKVICTFDFLMAPIMLILGIWRANEYFYLARLATWGILIKESEGLFLHYTKGKIKLFWYYAAVFAAFTLWLVFRIMSEWNDLKIMPYILSFDF